MLAWHIHLNSGEFPDCLVFMAVLLLFAKIVLRGMEPLLGPWFQKGHIVRPFVAVYLLAPLFPVAGLIFYANDFLMWCYAKLQGR